LRKVTLQYTAMKQLSLELPAEYNATAYEHKEIHAM
jgi:hypothetical protein